MSPARLTRRGLIALAGGLAVGGALLPEPAGERADDRRIRLLAGETPPNQTGIVSCEQWYAREPTAPVTVLDNRPNKILVHHTATVNRDEVSATDLGVLARAIQDFHMDSNGWIDSGHHFLVNRGGLIAEGRHQSLSTLLEGKDLVEGAHCPDQNETSIGIENQGTYTEDDPPTNLLVGLRALCAYVCSQYDIEPSQLYGHRDFRDTACPGDRLYRLLPWLRNQVGQMLGKGTEWRASPVPTWPLLRVSDHGPVVLAAQHLMRAAGLPGVPADGAFGASTEAAVYAFQDSHGLEHTGMIGGGSWPLLAVDVRSGQGGEAEAAVQVLLNRPEAAGMRAPAVVTRPVWQQLLAAPS